MNHHELNNAFIIEKPLVILSDKHAGQIFFQTLEDREREDRHPLLTGFKELDDLTKGLNGLVLLRGPSDSWKTWLAKQIADDGAIGGTALFFTFGQSVEDLMLASIARRGEIDVEKIVKLGIEDTSWGPMSAGLDKCSSDLSIIECDHTCTPEVLWKIALNKANEIHYKQILVVIDSLEQVPAAGEYFSKIDRMQAVMVSLRRLARDLTVFGKQSCAVLCLSSTMDSPEINSLADTIIDASELNVEKSTQDSEPDTKLISLRLIKNRFGEVGSFNLTYKPARPEFVEFQEAQPKKYKKSTKRRARIRKQKNQRELFKE